jgi:para-aminobenzoate synthetase component 1
MRVLAQEIAFVDPLRAFAALRDLPAAVLLDSARVDPLLGRWSYVAADPFMLLTSKDGRIRLGERSLTGDPFAVLQRLLRASPLERDPALPPFQTGAAGYLGYDLCHHLERLPAPELDDLRFADLMLGFYDTVVAFDLIEMRAWVMSSGLPEISPEPRMHRRRARLDWLVGRLADAPEPSQPSAVAAGPVDSGFSRDAYEAMVARVVDYILAGDIFQANVSQRFTAQLPNELSPFDLYRRLRARNPAPFAAFMDFGDTVIASASPERFLRLDGGKVETRPIKGTRPRHPDPATDAALGAELQASEKDRAENVMIVDLLRNDLSRVCREHSVLTPEICALHSFATVHHLVSTVTGELRQGADAVDLLRATFPGGSITGAPKIRAIEIIAELEPTRRGPYCGALLWLGLDGSMDSAITIRTFAIKGRTVTFQAGGGIVADSQPAAEYDETLDKARALIKALAGPDGPYPLIGDRGAARRAVGP